MVISAWEIDKNTFGLRGYEKKYPDSHKINLHIFGGTALVKKGFLHKKNEQLQITDTGLVRALSLSSLDIDSMPRMSKHLQKSVIDIIIHPIFIEWKKDPTFEIDMRSAGRFWGISPGTPPKAGKNRITKIDTTLKTVLNFLDKSHQDNIKDERGKILFEQIDVKLCIEFNKKLKSKLKKELEMMGYY